FFFFFFFQAEDGIRDRTVTGVQTCAFRSGQPVGLNALVQAYIESIQSYGLTEHVGALNRLMRRRLDIAAKLKAHDGTLQPLRRQIGKESCRQNVPSRNGSEAGREEQREDR